MLPTSQSPAAGAFPLPRSVCAAALVLWLAAAVPAAAEGPPLAGTSPRLQVYAYTMKHQQAHEALALVRPLLSPRGTVEVHPGGNTLVFRETPQVIQRLTSVLKEFDHQPEPLRFEIQIVRAGPKRYGVSPPQPEPPQAGLPEARAERLRALLRYDDYRVLAEAGVSSREGEEVTYSLGQTYNVSFRSGTVMAGRRVKLEGFRIEKHVKNPENKGRQLEPRELFHATLNLWIDRPFSLVLAQDEARGEALMVVISCRRESGERGGEGAPRVPDKP